MSSGRVTDSSTLVSKVSPFAQGVRDDGSAWVKVEVAFDEGWAAAATFMINADHLVLAELAVLPATGRRSVGGISMPGAWDQSPDSLPPGSGVTARLIRQIPLRKLLETAEGQLDALRRGPTDGRRDAHLQAASEFLDAPKRTGRRGQDDRYYALWALRYTKVLGSRSPVRDLALEHDLRPSQVRDLLHEARTRGVLTKGARGKAGGTLTDKARSLLSAESG